MRKQKKTSDLLVNLFLLLIVSALYYVTTVESALSSVPVMAPVYRGAAEEKVSLQFAVSWNASALSGIMDTLQAQDVHVTFVVSGEYARENPEMVARMAAEGHEIATMGDKPSFDGKLSAVVEDIEASLNSIEAAAGVRPVLYYSGSRNSQVSARAAKKLELTQVLSTMDLLCAKGNAADIVRRASETGEGSILLLQPTAAAAEALPALIGLLQGKGLAITTTSGVLGKQ